MQNKFSHETSAMLMWTHETESINKKSFSMLVNYVTKRYTLIVVLNFKKSCFSFFFFSMSNACFLNVTFLLSLMIKLCKSRYVTDR